jgi:WD40 repeat protein
MSEEDQHSDDQSMSRKADETQLFADQDRSQSEDRDLLRRVGDYELQAEIAAGGMGIVYRARQISLNRLVAVKMIRFAHSASGKERQRFLAEAEAVATLSHPNIVPIYEVGECDGQPYYSMQLITGGSLAESILRGGWPVAENATCRRAATLVATLARAVHDAHSHGIIHRDLKPGNVLLDDAGCPYLTDFGLAKQFDKGDALTVTGEIIGTPAFMSPEQAAGQAATTAVDIYALGAILYALLAGRNPFDGGSPVDVLKQVLESTPPSLRSRNAHADLDLETICFKCLNKDPVERYSTALELSRDLDAWLNGDPITARPISRMARAARWASKNPVTIGIASAALALVLLVFGSLLVGYWSTSEAVKVLAAERYAKQIADAQADLLSGDAWRLESFIKNYRLEAGQRDFRGWEWNYLHRKQPVEFRCRLADFDGILYPASISPLGNALAIPRLAYQQGGAPEPQVSIILADQSASSDLTTAMLENLAKGESDIEVFDSPLAFPRQGFSPCIEWSSDGKLLATRFQGDELRLWDAATGNLVETIQWSASDEHALLHSLLKWNHSGSRIAMVSSEGALKIYDLTSRKFVLDTAMNLPNAPAGKLEPIAFAWGPQEQWLALSVQEKTYFFNPQTGTILDAWPFPVLAWTNDSRRWAANTAIGNAESSESQLVIEGLVPRPGRDMLAWSPDGERIACMHDKLTVFNASTGAVDAEYDRRNYYPPKWFPDGKRLIVGSDILKDIFWSPKDRQIAIAGAVRRLSVSHAGERAAFVYNDSNEVQSVDEFGGSLSTFAMHDAPVAALNWSFDDSKVASLDVNGVVRVWDPRTKREIQRFDGLQAVAGSGSDPVLESCWQVWWSPGDQYLAASTSGNLIRVWDVQTSQQVYSSKGNGIRAIGWTEEPVALIADTNFAASFFLPQVSERPTIQTWEVSTGKQCSFPIVPHVYNGQPLPLPKLLPKSNLLCISIDSECWYQSLETRGMASQQGIRMAMADGIAFSNSPRRMLALNFGQLTVVNPENNAETLRLRNVNTVASLAVNADKLWIAERSKLTVYDGSEMPWGKLQTVQRMLNAHRKFVRISSRTLTPVIMFSLCLPIWVMCDRAIRLSGLQRWLVATACCATGLAWFSLTSPDDWKLMPAASDWQAWYAIISLYTFLAIFISGLIAESLRLTLQGRWRLPLVCGLFLLCVPVLDFASRSWPSAAPRTWAIADTFLLLQLSSLLGLALFVVRFMPSLTSGARSASLRFVSAPGWVRWSLWGTKSVRDALFSGCVNLAFAILLIIVPSRLAVLPDWVPQSFFCLAIVTFFVGIANLSAALWVHRHGGWQAQLGGDPAFPQKQDQRTATLDQLSR